MQSPQTEPAPFVRGDRVIFRARPAGIETVESVDYVEQGWPGWYVATRRLVDGATLWRYARAEDFERTPADSVRSHGRAPAAVPCRRAALVIAGLAALGWLVVLYGVLLELPS